jgi:hypothetical protein
VVKFFKDLTPIKQAIGMLYQLAFPNQYEHAVKIVEHWKREDPAFNALVHTPRETATYFVLNANVVSEPHVDPSDSEDSMTALHVWGDFDVESGGHLALPLFGRSYRMERDSILFLKASLVRHHVTRWKEMSGQRFSAVHITQDNMANFKEVKLPPNPQQKSAWQKESVAADPIKECPFCAKQMEGSKAVNSHLYPILKKGGDDLHPFEETKKWSDEKKEETMKVRKARIKKRKAESLAEQSGEDEDGEDDEPTPKKVKHGKKVPFSEGYEQYGKVLFDENAK